MEAWWLQFARAGAAAVGRHLVEAIGSAAERAGIAREDAEALSHLSGDLDQLTLENARARAESDATALLPPSLRGPRSRGPTVPELDREQLKSLQAELVAALGNADPAS